MVTAIILVALLFAFWEILAVLALIYGVMCGLRSLHYLGQRNPAGVVIQAGIGFVLLAIGLSALSRTTGALGSAALTGSISATGSTLFATFVLVVIGTIVVGVWYRLAIHQTVLDSLGANTFDPGLAPAPPAQHRQRLNYLAEAQYGNVTIYARAAQGAPFIGCGQLQEAWSLAIPLIPADPEGAGPGGGPPDSGPPTERLTLAALYRKMRLALVSLSDPESAEGERIEGLSLQDRIFVSGLLPATHPLIDRNKEPRFRVTAEELRQLAQAERNKATHYLTLRISGWEGELDVTVFLFFSVRGHMLYFEFLGTALPSIKSTYQAIDSYEQVTGAVMARAGLGAILEAPSLLANAPVNLANPIIETLRKQLDVRSQLQRMATRLAFDFGARGSVREFGADWEQDNLFHELDSGRYLQIVKRRAVDAVIEVLEEAGYSTDEFIARASVNIDNSTNNFVQGANSAMSIGTNSSANARTTNPSSIPQRSGPKSPGSRK